VKLETYLRPDFFRALADPTRLAVLARLACAKGPLTVTEVAGCCGVHLSGVSRHLAALHAAGIVRVERAGREALYRLDAKALADTLRGFADALEECCT
jgi:DNA-binding transcriptional ArsR family regulator